MFCITGYNAIEEYLKAGKFKGRLLFSRRGGRIERLLFLSKKTGIPLKKTSSEELDRISKNKEHRGVLLIVEEGDQRGNISLKNFLKYFQKEKALILLLDGITDPQNYGSILRSADQFYVDLVIIRTRRAVGFSQAVAKASSGADQYVPISVNTNLNMCIELLKSSGFWVYGADVSGENIWNMDFKGKVAIVMGSEGGGLSRLVRESCDYLVKIPACGHIDSFNVSVAAGILMYEVRRQHQCFS
ncbi:MAG: 23S rRNA (guanosine(2251)-2'-O)-methyltransferase RlmB [Spirochaetes bacterium]|nr:MAG: 23S rRNA (guanosine(2251)-2'-O)-methyltransferase RlmB [Spirochaetota bacterium]